MHKKKLVFLSISLLLLLFVSFGTTYAFTFDDFCEFISTTSNYVTGTGAADFKASASYIVANKEYIKEQAEAKGINLDNYNGWFVGKDSSCYFVLNAVNTSNAYTTNGINVNFAANTSTLQLKRFNFSPYQFRSSESSGTNITYRAWGLMDYNPTNRFQSIFNNAELL